MCLTSLLGTDSADNVCPIVNCLLGMKCALFSCESLVNDFCVFVDAEIEESVDVLVTSGRGREESVMTEERTDCCTANWRQHWMRLE
jgi:hypothetical protein